MNNRREPMVHLALRNWMSFATTPAVVACDRRAMVMVGKIDQREQKAHPGNCYWMLDCTEVEMVGEVVKDSKQGSNRTDRCSRMERESIPCSHVREVEQGQGCNNGYN